MITITIHKKLQPLFPPNSPKSSRTHKSKNPQISSNSPSNHDFLFDSISNHLLLQLFWKINIKISTNGNCSCEVQPWHLRISCTRGKFEPSYKLHSSSLTSFFICFEKPRANTTGISTAISRYFKIESHELMNCYMRFIECST